MTQSVLIPIHVRSISPAEQLAALGMIATPPAAAINCIRAYARAFRPL